MQKEKCWARLGLAAILSISAGIAFVGQAEVRQASHFDATPDLLIEISPQGIPTTTFDGRTVHIDGSGEPDWRNCTSDA